MVIYQFIVHRPLLLPVSTTNNHLSQPSHTGPCRTVGHLEMMQTGTHHPVSMAISGTDLLEVPTIYIRPMYGNIPTKYGLIWYSTSILGS